MDASRAISIRYNETIANAKELNRISVELKGMADQAKEDLELLSGSWNGDAGDLYRKKLQREVSLVEERAKALSEAADALKTAAEKTYSAELYAIQLLGG